MPYAAGSCRGCGRRPRPGKSRCKRCEIERNRKAAKLRQYRRSHGLCLVCGKPVAMSKLDRGGHRVDAPSVHCDGHRRYYAERWRAASG